MDAFDRDAAIAALAWQIELGADEAICDEPLDRYALSPSKPAAPAEAPRDAGPVTPPRGEADNIAGVIAEATRLAATANDLETLAQVMQGFDGCVLKQGARNFIFAAGPAEAPLMIIGDPPGRQEDIEGRPLAGPPSDLLDRMLGAIGRERGEDAADDGVYIVPVMPWRAPNRDPSAEELSMMRPFLLRHIELATPRCLMLMGSIATRVLFDVEGGVTAHRGTWREVAGIPAIATFHPAALLRNPAHKRAAWMDLLDVKAKLT